jgi:hypothetical protein
VQRDIRTINLLSDKYGAASAAQIYAMQGMPTGVTPASLNTMAQLLEAEQALAKLGVSREEAGDMEAASGDDSDSESSGSL